MPNSSRKRASSTSVVVAETPSETTVHRPRATPTSTVAGMRTPTSATLFDDPRTPLTGGSKLGPSLLQFVAEVIESLENAARLEGTDQAELK